MMRLLRLVGIALALCSVSASAQRDGEEPDSAVFEASDGCKYTVRGGHAGLLITINRRNCDVVVILESRA